MTNTNTTQTANTTATYTKLRDGSWGVRIPGPVAPVAGSTVAVEKRSGERKLETIGRVVWQGADVVLCSIGVPVAARPSSPVAARSTGRGRRTGCSCGSREDKFGDLIPSSRNCASCEHDA